ncbi:TolC family protein [Parabacteroides sp. OttesenSCG-928-N08]|nr:TolC family protein [Parabacteroides sp. OttesenSCG-928-N08]
MKIDRILILAILLFSLGGMAQGQQVTTISYRDYMEKVTSGNLEFAAERLNVDISNAEIVAAKVFNDPTLAVSYYNNDEKKMAMGYGTEIELSKAFTFGTRRAGINLAKSEKELTEALLADYFRNLRADATLSYLEAMKQQQLFQVKQDACSNMQQLAASDSVRFMLGEIREIDALQTRLEADLSHNDWLQSKTELYAAFSDLNLLIGSSPSDTLFQPTTTLQPVSRDFILNALIATALDNRADLVAALKNKEVADRALTLVRRERNPEIELSLSVGINARVDNEIAPAPSFTGYAAGIAIPLKFSNANKGNLRAAQLRRQQAEMQQQQVELQIHNEVMQSFLRYQSMAEQVKRYEEKLLADARKVIDGKIFSYRRGEVSLLEVLDAQRTYNEVQEQYIERLYNFWGALVELERAAGIWDIEI